MSDTTGHLLGDPEVCARLADAGIATVGDLLAQSTCTRELPDRSNHVFERGDLKLHVKRARRPGRGVPREARALIRLREAGVPTAALGVYGVDAQQGALTATFALEPARPLDALLQENTLPMGRRRRARSRVASLVATLHAARFHHKDLYLNHLFLDVDDPLGVVRVIDVERLGKHRRALGRWVVKDLAALYLSVPADTVTEAEMTRFLVAYLKRRGLPRRGVLPGLVRRIQKKAGRMAAHTPKTPVGEAARPN